MLAILYTQSSLLWVGALGLHIEIDQADWPVHFNRMSKGDYEFGGGYAVSHCWWMDNNNTAPLLNFFFPLFCLAVFHPWNIGFHNGNVLRTCFTGNPRTY